MNLSKNFTLTEFIRSQTASRNGIDNYPSDEVLIQLVYTAIMMEQVRALFDAPVYPSSVYRVQALNDAIGSTGKDHPRGVACDFTVKGYSNLEVVIAIQNSDIDYSKLILEYPKSKNGGWVHIAKQPYQQPGDKVNLLATRTDNGTIYTNLT